MKVIVIVTVFSFLAGGLATTVLTGTHTAAVIDWPCCMNCPSIMMHPNAST